MLNVVDAPFDEALLLARGVVFGVLAQIPMGARFCDRFDDVRTSFALELFQLRPQPLGAAKRHGSALHVGSCLCRSLGVRFTPTFPCANPAVDSLRCRPDDRARRKSPALRPPSCNRLPSSRPPRVESNATRAPPACLRWY